MVSNSFLSRKRVGKGVKKEFLGGIKGFGSMDIGAEEKMGGKI